MPQPQCSLCGTASGLDTERRPLVCRMCHDAQVKATIAAEAVCLTAERLIEDPNGIMRFEDLRARVNAWRVAAEDFDERTRRGRARRQSARAQAAGRVA